MISSVVHHNDSLRYATGVQHVQELFCRCSRPHAVKHAVLDFCLLLPTVKYVQYLVLHCCLLRHSAMLFWNAVVGIEDFCSTAVSPFLLLRYQFLVMPAIRFVERVFMPWVVVVDVLFFHVHHTLLSLVLLLHHASDVLGPLHQNALIYLIVLATLFLSVTIAFFWKLPLCAPQSGCSRNAVLKIVVQVPIAV